MKQILQNLKTGKTEVVDVPCPKMKTGHLLVQTRTSLISAGTERMLLEFGRANWVEKARQQPDKVSMVIDKVKTDGLMPTVEAVFNKIDQPLPLGYCNVGSVIDTAVSLRCQVLNLKNGDRVVSNGPHAEAVCVPVNLCAKVPDGVSDEEATFTILGAIGLQGIRLAQPTLGECFVVYGLGLIGLLTVQLLKANGYRVIGVDVDSSKCRLSESFGAETVDLAKGEDPLAAAEKFSRGRGVDGVLITASSKSSEPVHQAAQMCRKRGRIVLVGVTGLELNRSDFYKKELSFQVSCSYGPGRYDPEYEDKGHDYPIGYVRWTEQRNFEAVLDMMADGRIDVRPLISHRFLIEEAEKAYEIISGAESSLGILLEYPTATQKSDLELSPSSVDLIPKSLNRSNDRENLNQAKVAFVGAGNYATAVLIPAFKAAGAHLISVASSGGVSGVHAGRKFGFEQTTTDTDSLFSDSRINTVVITTRHDSHSRLVCQVLSEGKHVFVEKPLALTMQELTLIERTHIAAIEAGHQPLVMVGFNRRFAPQIQKMKSFLSGVKDPKAFVMTINAGAIPSEHWTQDPAVGGGRIVGEACHFIDLLSFLSGAPIIEFHAVSMCKMPELVITEDKASITLRFEDGSIGTILYLANGHKSFPKERLEVFVGGRILQLDNYRKLKGFGWPGFRKMNFWRQNKGQKECATAFVQAVEEEKPSPIPFDELIEVSRVSIEVADSLR